MNERTGVVRLMRALFRIGSVSLACVLWAWALGDSGVMRLTSFPTISVADGRSTITVSAEIRDTNGKLATDGTRVVFSTTLGSFREPVVQTEQGVARAVLVAGSIPGMAKVTVTAVAYNATSTHEIEFVADRALLASAKDFIEVVAPQYLMYSLDQRILGAADPSGGVALQYKEIDIRAEDLQLTVPTYEVRARKATLKMGRIQAKFDELYLKLNERRGFGTTSMRTLSAFPVSMGAFSVGVPEEKDRYGIYEVRFSGIKPLTDPLPHRAFEFEDLSESASSINAKKAVAYPRRQVQFHQADIYVGAAKVLTLPLFQVSLYGQTPILTEQIVNVYDNQVSVNYPHYLSLKPGQTSLLRFRWGDRYGRGYSTTNGASLDYELNWYRGDDMEGGFTINGLARSDWGLGARHYQRLDDRTTLNLQLEFPAHKSVYGSGSISRQFDGYHATLNAHSSRALRGDPFTSESYSFVVEKDPTKLGNLPIRLYYGLTASQSETRSEFYSREQTAVGMRARFQMLPQPIDDSTTVNASLLVSKLSGTNTPSGLGLLGDVSLSKRFGPGASAVLTYNYAEDGFTSSLIGRHNLSLQGHYGVGRANLSLFGSQSIDVDRVSYFADASYRVGGNWRLSYGYTYNRYLGDDYLDDSYMVSYRLGAREFGLVWTRSTKRIGLQVLGAPIQ